jgi:hypothetical protein
VYTTGARATEWTANGVPKILLIPKPFAPAQMVTALTQLINEAAGASVAHPGPDAASS